MTTFLLPLSNIPQTFDISLGGLEYTLTCRWNDADDGGWLLTIADALTAVVLADNIPLITGADCLAGLEYLGINGQIVVYTDGDQFAVPTLDNLGVEANAFFLTEVAS